MLQQVDVALPPDYKSKPSRALIVIAAALLAFLATCVVAVWRGYSALSSELDPQRKVAWVAMTQAWRLRR